MSENIKKPSLEEMWKVMEGFGIKREIFERYLPTEKDVSELYHLIEKRLHYQREQEMIRRLRAYVEKLKTDEFWKSLEQNNQNTTEID